MHYIPKCPPAPLVINGKPYDQVAGVAHILDTCKVFNSSGAGIRMAARVERTFAAGAWPVPVEDADWGPLRDAFESPDAGYCPVLTIVGADGTSQPMNVPGRTFVAWVDAVANAPDKAPEPAVVAAPPAEPPVG